MSGQTLREIRALLASAGLAPQHRYGQNFLHDLNLLRKLVDAGEVSAEDVVLEVGPGTGSLTELLLGRGARVIAAEIDRGLQELLSRRLGNQESFTLIRADALSGKHHISPLILQALSDQIPAPGGRRKLVANLPYQIATPLLGNLLFTSPALERMVCTIQREVGERLLARPRTSAYGPLSVIMQLFADIDVIATLPPSVFWPAPQVESIMLRIHPKSDYSKLTSDAASFSRFVHDGFAQRRKMLRRLVREWRDVDGEAVFSAAGVNPDLRPEELSPEDWLRLFHSRHSDDQRSAHR